MTITEDEAGMVTAGITFDGDEGIFEDNDINGVSCYFRVELEFDDQGEFEPGASCPVQILENSYSVRMPPLVIEYAVTKDGAVNLAARYIEWTVTITAEIDGDPSTPVDLEGYRFWDDLGGAGAYKDFFTVNGDPRVPAVGDGGLGYLFPEGSMSPQEITLRTDIPDEQYYSDTQNSQTNRAYLHSGEGDPLGNAQKQVTFTPEWIVKDGTATDSGSSGVYEPTGRTITWTIIANRMEAMLEEAVITDPLPGNLQFHSAYWQEWDGSDWESTKTGITPTAEGEYALGDIDARILLTITATVPDEDFTAGVTTYTNRATIRWAGLPSTVTAPGASKGVSVGYNAIAKSGALKDAARGIISWTVTVNPRGQEIPQPRVYDLLVYGSSNLDWDGVTFPDGVGAEIVAQIRASGITPHCNQKYIDHTFEGTGLQPTVHRITNPEGEPVADLLEITGFTSDESSFTFDSLITNPALFAGNSSSTLSNTAALYSGSAKLNEASSGDLCQHDPGQGTAEARGADRSRGGSEQPHGQQLPGLRL